MTLDFLPRTSKKGFSSWVYYCKISTLNTRHRRNSERSFSSWVYYCKISTHMKAFLEETHLVSVAEFITVRFQLHAAGFLVRQRPVSVAEFITVRFQPGAGCQTVCPADLCFSSWVYYCKISTWCCVERTAFCKAQVSVAEFITVRFQLAGNAMDAQKNMFQ